MSINNGLDLKTRFVWEKKKRKAKIEISAIFFEVGAQSFLQVTILKAFSLILISWYLLKSWWKK